MLYNTEYHLTVLVNTMAFLFFFFFIVRILYLLSDHPRSSSEAGIPVKFKPQPQLRPLIAKHYQKELVPMAHLDRRDRSSHLSGRRGNAINRHHFTRADNRAAITKPRGTVRKLRGYESEEETEMMAPARPLDI